MHVPFKTYFSFLHPSIGILNCLRGRCFFKLIGYTVGESPYDFDWRIGVVFSAGLLDYFGKFNISYWCVGLTLKANWQGRVIVMNQKDSNFTFKISSGLFTVEEKHNSVRYLITSAATWRKSHFKMSPSFTWFVYLLKFFFYKPVAVGTCWKMSSEI